LKNKSHFMALSHGSCSQVLLGWGGGDYDGKSLCGASCFETKPSYGCCSNWGMSFYHPIHLRSFWFLTNNKWERRLLRFREARIYRRDLVWRASRFGWFGAKHFYIFTNLIKLAEWGWNICRNSHSEVLVNIKV
jgi:hypothetical protein